jgi:hypothetical protein
LVSLKQRRKKETKQQQIKIFWESYEGFFAGFHLPLPCLSLAAFAHAVQQNKTEKAGGFKKWGKKN